jgi:hypothetical protein
MTETPFFPVTHFHQKFMVALVKFLDEYRDIRLVWSLVEAVLILIILGLVVYMIIKMKRDYRKIKEKYKCLEDKIKKIKGLHERMDQINDSMS